MKKNLILLGIALCVLTLTGLVFASSLAGFRDRGTFFFPPAPRLIYPVTDVVTLAGNGNFEFKWDINDFVETYSYDFRLYKGYETVESNLILKETLPYYKDSLKVKAGLLQDNQVYTWTLSRAALGGRKSDRSFISFKIIKK